MPARTAALVAVALTCAPLVASAEPIMRATARAGWAMPLGYTEKDIPLKTNAAAEVPVGVELGVRVAKPLIVGVYGQYGAVITRGSGDWTSVCQVDDDCTGTDVHLGVQAHYHFAPAQRFDPWVGMGIGYEWYALRTTRARYMWRGIEVANLQGGLDVALGRVVSAGPFVAVSLGQFSRLSVDPASAGFGGALENTALHQWLTFGARGSADFL